MNYFVVYMTKCFATKNESEKLKVLLTAIIMSSMSLVSYLEIPPEIHQRIESGDGKLLRLPGIDINMQDENGFTVLHYASFAHHNNCVKLLLMYQADPNVKNNKKETPLHLAISQGNYKIALDLLKGGANANIQNQDGRTPLHMCSELTFQLLVSIENQHKLISALLAAGAVPHLPDNYGKTLYRVAVLEENASFVALLLSLGAGPN